MITKTEVISEVKPEQWKDIPGFEGHYQVSDCGRVRSLDRQVNVCVFGKRYATKTFKGRIIKPYISRHGYYHVKLTACDGTKQSKTVASLVLLAFVGDRPYEGCQINHKDENKLNNQLSNLEYCDSYYNLTYGTRLSRIDDKLKRKKIGQYTIDGDLVKVWDSISEASRAYGHTTNSISQCCQHKYGFKSAYGYKWEYYEERN